MIIDLNLDPKNTIILDLFGRVLMSLEQVLLNSKKLKKIIHLVSMSHSL